MAEVKLYCALLGEATVFPVKIALDENVSTLQQAIFDGQLFGDRSSLVPSQLTLYLARTEGGVWLKDDDDLKKFLQGGVSTEYEEMRPSWKLNKKELFGATPSLGEENIHVLVQVLDPFVVVVPTDNLVESPYKKQRYDVLNVNVPQVDISGQYVMLPSSLLQYCCVGPPSDILLYRRPQVSELWTFLAEEVVANNSKGYIVGPPGTGKSMCTLSFMASLDRVEWLVVWIHLHKEHASTCLVMGLTSQTWLFDLASFQLPRSPNGRKLFVCLDGYNRSLDHKSVLEKIEATLGMNKDHRFVVCSSMATLGKRNVNDDQHTATKFFFMHSWLRSEYHEALLGGSFYDSVKDKLDATSPSEVNEEIQLANLEDLEAKIDWKYYYAGGSCRFMFEFTTDKVKTVLEDGVECTPNKNDLIAYCGGKYHTDEINRLYGMNKDRERFAVSAYALSLFVKACGPEAIVELAHRLDASKNPSMDGFFFEWYFLASVPHRQLRLYGLYNAVVDLPQANVLSFDPKKKIRKTGQGVQRQICGNKMWLKPILWNQGGYDAVYFDVAAGEVIFIQVTRSDKLDFKLRFFFEVLLKLEEAGMPRSMKVEVYFVVKPEKLAGFKIGHIEDHDVLTRYDERWTNPEDKHVQVLAFRAP
ncbi:unnamed protein product [Aphanomyces euteiches]